MNIFTFWIKPSLFQITLLLISFLAQIVLNPSTWRAEASVDHENVSLTGEERLTVAVAASSKSASLLVSVCAIAEQLQGAEMPVADME